MNLKFYITTSIAYANAEPHIGFALELIQADALARYHRLRGDDVWFLTGTDEHGIKISRTAGEHNKTPQEFVDENAGKFLKLAEVLKISNDDFIRTTDCERHWPSVQKMWRILKENNDIYKKEYEGLYCSGCEAFKKEKDLIDGKCLEHNRTPEPIKEENYFFRLSKYSEKIGELIEKDEIKIIPHGKKHEILSLVKSGLEDVSFSRSRDALSWGVPVPDDETQTMYVWCDALVNYISALDFAENSEKFKKYWPADIHCIGKDILRFHAAIWLGMLLSANLQLPKKIFVHGFITFGGQKMSKSLGNVIDPFELVDKYGVDAVRYYLLREISSVEDGDFTVEKFEARYNGDLANGLGNLVSRFGAMAEKLDFMINEADGDFRQKIDNVWVKYKIALDDFEFAKALEAVWELVGFCDGYITEKKPWELIKDKEKNSESLKIIFSNLFHSIASVGWMLEPFLPDTAGKILKNLNIEKDKDGWKGEKLDIAKIEALFPRLN